MFIFRTFKSVRICVSLKLSKTLLFFGLKIANFCLKKRNIGYTHTREEEEEEEVCSLFLCHRVWFNTDLSEQGGFFTSRERECGFFFVRVVIAFHSWSSLRVALALFLRIAHFR